MPHLKFTRDRRGYESTFLVDTPRGRGRRGPRVLYWFRSPPHVKVGRAAIDEDAIRDLQAQYPDIDFDWDRILEAKPPAPEPDEQSRARGRSRDRRRDPQRGRDRREASPDSGEEAAESRAPYGADAGAPAESPVAVEHPDTTEDTAGDPDTATGEVAASAVEQALGSEGLSRVRARYAEVLTRVHGATLDFETQARLIESAERLNPDAWVTSAQVQEGIREFERVLAEISAIVGVPRRRTRRGGRRTRGRRDQPDGAGHEPAASPAPAASDVAPDDDDGSS